MKCIKHSAIFHKHEGYFHLWLIPSIEVDYEHFKHKKLGEHKRLYIYFNWLFWDFDIKFDLI